MRENRGFRIPGIPQPTRMRLLEVPRRLSGWTALRVLDSRHPPRRRWGRPSSLNPTWFEWNCEADRGPGPFAGRNPKPAVVCLDDGAANREAHAHSVLLRCKEGLEGSFGMLESGSAIPYL